MLKKFFITLFVGFIVLNAFLSIDYTTLVSMNFQAIMRIIQGLLTPDWSYIWDGSGEDLTYLLGQTLIIAFYGTALGVGLSVPFALLSAESLWGRWRIIPQFTHLFLNLLRSIPVLIYAILCVRVVGPGPFAGALALAIQLVGMLGKLFGETLDQANMRPIEAVRAAGASDVQAFLYARIPQALPLASSHILNHFEINLKSATTLGLVGAGGIGAPIIFALQQRNWGRVSIILIAIILVVMAIDALSSLVRYYLR